jgi:hypothetical protein
MRARPVLLAVTLLAFSSAAALGQTTPAAAPGNPSLEGYFLLNGRITSAVHIPGEHAGQRLRRSWVFLPLCRAGACVDVALIRSRGRGGTIVLHRTAPALYQGEGSFFAPVRCGHRVFRTGATVPFAIAVRILSTRLAGSAGDGATRLVASAIRATYTNPLRVNRTPCVAVSARDSATYRLRRPTLR